MPNGRRYTTSSTDRLDERVTNLHTRVGALETTVNQGFQQIEASVGELTREIGRGRTTNWVAVFSGLGALFALVSTIGYLTIDPVRTNQARLEALVERAMLNTSSKDNFDKLRERLIDAEKRMGELTTKRESDIRDRESQQTNQKLSERVDALAAALNVTREQVFQLAVRAGRRSEEPPK